MFERLQQKVGAIPFRDLFKGLERGLAKKMFSATDRIALYQGLVFLLDNNKKLEEALEWMKTSLSAGQRYHPPVVFCLRDALAALRRGLSLDRGLSEWIPKSEAAILSAGIEEGNLSAALRRAIDVVNSLSEMKSALISKMAYPALLLISILSMMVMVSHQFLPQIEQVLPREKWKGALYWMSVISDAIGQNLLVISGFFLLGAIWIGWSLPNLTGKARRTLDFVFPWSLYRDVQGVAFLLNFSALIRAQIRSMEVLTLLSRHASPWLYERLIAARRQLQQGKSLGLALRDSGYNFPSKHVINTISFLIDGDGAEDSIENIARDQLKASVTKIQKLSSIFSYSVLALATAYLIMMAIATQDIGSLNPTTE